MKNLLISQKLIVSFIVVIVISVIIGVVGIIGMLQLDTAQSAMYNSNTAPLGDLAEAQQLFQRIRANVRANEVNGLTNVPDSAKTTTAQTEDFQKQFVAALDKFDATIVATELKTRFKSMRDSYNKDYVPFIKEINDMCLVLANDDENKTTDDVIAKINSMGTLSTQISDDLDWCMNFKIQQAAEKDAEGSSLFNSLLILIIVIIVIAAVASIIIALYISNLISKPLQFMAGALKQVGDTGDINFSDAEWATAAKFGDGKDETAQAIAAFGGTLQQFVYYGEQLHAVAVNDLTHDIKVLGDRDTIGNAMKTMLANLNEMFSEINGATGQVHTGAQQISDGSQALAQGATEQAASVEELSSSINEVAGKTQENADLANRAADLSAAVRDNAQKGAEQMDAMMNAVKQISDASNEINQVIKVIDNIAFQTNILALNAAVEAARAGQHGKGFAVVAEEVRSLAAKSADAAKDTGVLIENSIEKATLGAKIADETSASLNEIVSGINESTVIVRQIADSSAEQSAAIKQINIGIDQVAQVVQQNSATAQESAATAEELSGQSSMLDELVGRFQLKSSGQRTLSASRGGSANKKLPPAKNVSGGGGDSGGNFGKY
ncbi:MAG: methyl-accepting chemotaxis protein [Oscillospiraceae bacterium]|jgi:methyl-accepting chemotaxis protein|nr:methyl-accepting chemotaxis protein [Oscillospiraceae bacterium]